MHLSLIFPFPEAMAVSLAVALAGFCSVLSEVALRTGDVLVL